MINKINNLIIETTKSGYKNLLEVYKLVKAEFQKASKSGKPWDPVDVLLKMIAQRKDSITQFKEAGRMDLVKHEEYELQVIEDLLPPMPTEEEMREEILKVLPDNVGLKDTKGILETLKPRFPGITGKLVSDVIKSRI